MGAARRPTSPCTSLCRARTGASPSPRLSDPLSLLSLTTLAPPTVSAPTGRGLSVLSPLASLDTVWLEELVTELLEASATESGSVTVSLEASAMESELATASSVSWTRCWRSVQWLHWLQRNPLPQRCSRRLGKHPNNCARNIYFIL